MSEEPPPPSEARRSEPACGTQPQAPREPPERYGTVTIERHVKDDGRALLLYTRDAQGDR